MKKILITGANGLLAQALVKTAKLTDNKQIILTSRGKNRITKHQQLPYFDVELTDKTAVTQLIKKTKPNIVIHTAAMTQVDDCEQNQELAFKTNVLATRFLAQASEDIGAFFLYISTDFVFDGTTLFYTEKDTPSPVNYYGQTKWQAEKEVQRLCSRWAIARTVLVYGFFAELSRSNIVLWVIKNLKATKAIRVVNDQFRTPTWVEDLAVGSWLIVKKEATGIFHLSGKELFTPYELALKIAEITQLEASMISPTNANEFIEIGKRPLKTGFSIEKASQILNYQPHTFEMAFRTIWEEIK